MKAESNIIQHNTDELRAEWELIAKSRMDAMRSQARKRYAKIRGANENDPPELWRFIVGFSERLPDLTKNKTAKALAEHFRQVDPQFVGSPEFYAACRGSIGKPSLRETVAALAARAKDDAEIAGWLAKLLAIYRQNPMSRGKSNDDDETKQLLLLNWVQEPFGNITGSLAFFSDRAMAKLLYLLRHKKCLPPERLTTEPERIRKLYAALGLRPARRRAIKDLEYRAEKHHFVLNKTLTPKGR